VPLMGSSKGHHYSNKVYLIEVVHELFVFIEKILSTLTVSKAIFINSETVKITGETKGVRGLKRDYENFKSPDDTVFEVTYDGPGAKAPQRNGKVRPHRASDLRVRDSAR